MTIDEFMEKGRTALRAVETARLRGGLPSGTLAGIVIHPDFVRDIVNQMRDTELLVPGDSPAETLYGVPLIQESRQPYGMMSLRWEVLL